MVVRHGVPAAARMSLGTKTALAFQLFAAAVLSPHALAAQTPGQDLERPVNPRSGIPCPTPDQYSRERPDPPGTPTVVGAAMFFQDVTQFNDVDQTLTADVYIVVRWRDPRLADPRRGDASAECPLPGANLWSPIVEADNLRARQQFYDARFLVDGKGTITYSRRLLVQVMPVPNPFRTTEELTARGKSRQTEAVAESIGMKESAAVVIPKKWQDTRRSDHRIEKFGHTCEFVAKDLA